MNVGFFVQAAVRAPLACALLLVGALLTVPAVAAQSLPQREPSRGLQLVTEGGKRQSLEPKKSGRLRFRDGPVCMCADGLGEQDIRKAQALREAGEHSDTQSTDP